METSVIALVLLAAYSIVDCTSSHGGAEIYLSNLGTVEGKTYLYDKSGWRNWTTAVAYCEQYDMQIATIMTDAQVQFLKSRYTSTEFDGGKGFGITEIRSRLNRTYALNLDHWIGLRNANESRALSWHDSNLPLTLSLIQFYDRSREYLLCGLYQSSWNPILEMFPCSAMAPGVLCQTLPK